jgi:hypothetical protein
MLEAATAAFPILIVLEAVERPKVIAPVWVAVPIVTVPAAAVGEAVRLPLRVEAPSMVSVPPLEIFVPMVVAASTGTMPILTSIMEIMAAAKCLRSCFVVI